MGTIKSNTKDMHDDELYYFKGYVSLDNKEFSIKREEYNWNMWLIAIGGFERALKKFFGMMVNPFVEDAFVNAMLGHIFLMKKNRNPM